MLLRLARWFSPVIVASMLLVPATCSAMPGAHSIFVAPPIVTAASHHAHEAQAERLGLTVAELEYHAALGHIVLEDDPAPATASPAAERPILCACPDGPLLRDLPAPMLMDALTTPFLLPAGLGLTAESWRVRIGPRSDRVPMSHVGAITTPPPRSRR